MISSMLASREREEDRAALIDLYEIIEIAIRTYQRTENPELLIHIERLNKTKEWLHSKIETFNYHA